MVVFLSSVVEMAAFLNLSGWTPSSADYASYYWGNEVIIQTLGFLLMLSLIRRAMGASASSRVLLVVLVLLVVALSGVSVLTSRSPNPARWMTVVARNLSFFSALLNLVLWGALVRFRQGDSQLLMVSAGIGVETTGKAVGHSLRFLSRATAPAGTLLNVVSHLLCLSIWLWAFWRVREPVLSLAKRQESPAD